MPSPSDTNRSDVLYAFTEKLGLQVNLAGTGDSDRVELARALLLTGFAVRSIAPLVLSRWGLVDEARRLRRFVPPLKNAFDVVTAAAAIDSARDAAHLLALQARAQGDPDADARASATEVMNCIGDACDGAASAARDRRDVGYTVHCAVHVANAITKAIKAGVPEEELIDLATDALADAMVIQ